MLPKPLILPFAVDLDDVQLNIQPIVDNDERATAILERAVNPHGLELREGPESLDGSAPEYRLYVPESANLGQYLGRVINLISFLVDTPIRYSHKLQEDVLIPESSEDESRLSEFPTRRVFHSIFARSSIRTFSTSQFEEVTYESLLQKELGLALYQHALLSQEPLASYREYWKLLESAFGVQDNKLVELLSRYDPAQEIGFTEDELSELLILRGRASHAQSNAGIAEHDYVVSETSKKLPRLKCLVEQVVLTKRTWGVPATAIDRLAEVNAYIDSEGTTVFIKRD